MYELACMLLGMQLIGNQTIGNQSPSLQEAATICPGVQHHKVASPLLDVHPAASVRGVRLLYIDNIHVHE
jgi:hypothetical protein